MSVRRIHLEKLTIIVSKGCDLPPYDTIAPLKIVLETQSEEIMYV